MSMPNYNNKVSPYEFHFHLKGKNVVIHLEFLPILQHYNKLQYFQSLFCSFKHVTKTDKRPKRKF